MRSFRWAHLLGLFMNISWIKIAIIGTAMAVGFGGYMITRSPDGAVEQAAEAVLRTQGVDIDLSPDNG
jgi:hypothetical protein